MLEMLGLGILLEYQDKASANMLKTNKVFDQMYETSKSLTDAIKQNEESFKKLGVAAIEVTAIGTTFKNAGNKILGVLGKASKEAETFETEMQQLKFVTGATAEEFEQFRKVAIETGIATAFSPQEAAKAMYELKSAGLDNIAMLNSLNATLDVVALSAGKIDLASGAGLIASTLNKFNLDAGMSDHIADVFAEASKQTNFHIEDFPAFINSLGSAPSKVNLPLEEFVSLGGLLRNVGQEAAESGHTVAGFTRQILMLTRSLERGKTTALSGQKLDMLEEMGITQESLWNAEGKLKSMTEIFAEFVRGTANMTEQKKAVAFQTIFGDQASNMMYAVENATKAFMTYDDATGQYIETAQSGKQSLDDLVASLQNANGVAKEGADEILQTTWGIKKLWEGSVQTFGVLLGQTLLPFIGKTLQGLTSLLNKVIDFGYAHPTFMKALGMGVGLTGLLVTLGGVALLVAGGIMGLTSFIGLLTTKVQLWAVANGLANTGMLSMSSILGIVRTQLTLLTRKMFTFLIPLAKIALIVGGLYLAWKQDFLGIRTLVTDFYTNTKNAFLDAEEIIGMSVSEMIRHVRDLESSDNFFDSLTVAIVKLKMLWIGLCDAWSDNTLSDDNFHKLQQLGLLPIIEGVLELKFRFEALWSGIKTGFQSVLDIFGKIKIKFEEMGFSIDPLLESLKGIFGITDDMGSIEGWEKVGEAIGSIGTMVLLFGVAFKIVMTVIGLVTKIWGVVTTIGGAIGTVVSFVTGLFTTIGGFISGLVSGVISFGSTIMSVVGTALGAIAAFLGIPVWVAGLVVAAIAAVIAGIVYLWNNWEWFREAVSMSIGVIIQNIGALFKGLFDLVVGIIGNILGIIGGIIDFVVGVFTGDWTRAWEGVVKIFENIVEGIVNIFKKPINTVIGMINNVINGVNKIGFTTPDWDWLPDKYQNKTFGIDIPNVPQLNTGGYVQGEGYAYLHPSEVVINDELTQKLNEFLSEDEATSIGAGTSITSQDDNSVTFEEGSIQISVTGSNLDYDADQLFEAFCKKYERKQKIKKSLSYES